MDRLVPGLRDDLIPRPLKVLKRDINRAPAVTVTRSSSQSTLVPVRKSSVSERTQLSLPQHVLARSISSSINGDAFPAVRKPSQADNLSALVIATRNVTPRSTKLTVKPNSEKPTSGHSSTTIRITRPHQSMATANRSQSISATTPIDPSYSTNQQLHTNFRRRAVTTGEIPLSQKPPESTQSSELERQPSSRRRLISRVMNSFPGKSQTHSIKVFDGDEYAKNNPWKKESGSASGYDNIRHSVSSACSQSWAGSDLSEMLTAFPAPPDTKEAPSELGKEPFKISSTHISTDRRLSEPQSVLSLAAKIKVTPEFHRINYEKDESMFVALDIKGATLATGELSDESNPVAALDAVIIIDNS